MIIKICIVKPYDLFIIMFNTSILKAKQRRKKMRVIHIYGASGAGTTTLGEAISLKYGYTHMDTDNYFWQPTNPPFISKREPSERIALMKKDMEENDKVVISGSLCGWGDELIPSFNLAIRIVTPMEIRINRIIAREFEQFGNRIQLHGDMYEDHLAFVQWAKEYDNGDETMRSKAMHDKWSKLLQCDQVILDGERPVEDNLELLRPYLDC
jgi:adenylate kinase family enzyme